MPDVTVKPPEPSSITWGPIAAVVVTIVVYFMSQFFGSVLLLAYSKLNGWDAATITAWTDKTAVQFVYIAVVEAFTMGALWQFLKNRQASFKTLGLTKPQFSDIGWSLIGFGIYLPMLIASMLAIKIWFPEVDMNQSQQVGFQSAQGAALILVFLSLVVLPPVTEEIITRGFLFLGLRKKLPLIWAAIATSLIFAMAHLQFGSNAPLLWTAAVDTFILSMVLVYLRQKTGRLWASIGLHMIKNAIAFMALFIFVK